MPFRTRARRALVSAAVLSCAAAALIAAGCAPSGSPHTAAELTEVDTRFSVRSQIDGPRSAFLAFVAPDAKILGTEGKGSAAVENLYTGYPPGASLTWKVSAADIAASGELGYTWGRYVVRIPAPGSKSVFERSGNYVTVWKLQRDGSWKFVLDGGVPDSQPTGSSSGPTPPPPPPSSP